AAAEVDARVADGGRFRARAVRAEEQEVARCQLRERDPLRARHLAAHRVRRPALDRRAQRGAARVLLELVDTPDKARAVEAAAGLDSERRLGLLAGAAPHVREADEAHRGVENLRLPGGE